MGIEIVSIICLLLRVFLEVALVIWKTKESKTEFFKKVEKTINKKKFKILPFWYRPIATIFEWVIAICFILIILTNVFGK
jgi:hypothetical protein